MRIILRKVQFLIVIVFALFLVNCATSHIQPVGNQIAIDSNGNAIYQVPANGIKIGYKLIGQGQPLLLIMGLGWTMNQWPNDLIKELAQHHQLIIPDNRGIGYSSTDDKEFSYELFAGDIAALLKVLQVPKTQVLGYSMGTTITQKLLLDHPELIDKTVLLATTIDGSQLPKNLKDKMPDKEVIRRQLAASANWKTPLEKLPNIYNKTLLIVGSEDFIVGTESSEILHQNLPNSELQIFEDASHLLMYEQTDKLTKSILKFLE
jgi:pimeloyl-ACP methyl ester carboxylesterase